MMKILLLLIGGCLPLLAGEAQISGRLEIEPDGSRLPLGSAAAELILPASDQVDISVGVSSPGDESNSALPFSFSYFSASYTKGVISSFSRDIEGTLRWMLRGDGSVDLSLTMEAAFKAPPISHMLSGSITFSPPFGGSWSLTGSLLQVFSQGTGFSLFTSLQGEFSRISFSGLPAEHQSLMRAGARVSFAGDTVTHHVALECTFLQGGVTPRITYHVILDIPMSK